MKTLINRNLINLIIGEINRSIKYKVLTIGTGVSFIWLVIIFFMRKDSDMINMIVPLLIFTDAVMMSSMLIGASIFFEKQEGSIRSLIISPVTTGQILISKIINTVFTSIISALIVAIGAMIMSDIRINLFTLVIYIIVTVAAHAAIGFSISMVSKDFNSMLINYMVFVFIFVIPPVLLLLNILPQSYELLLFLSPSQAGNVLLNSTVTGSTTEWYKILISIAYLSLIAVALMKFFVYPRFLKDAVRG